MADVEYSSRVIQGNTEGQTSTKTVIMKKTKQNFWTNDQIEERKVLPKFGTMAGQERGVVSDFIEVEDKEFKLINPHKPAEENFQRMTVGSIRSDKIMALDKREEQLKEGRLEEARMKRLGPEQKEEFSLKVSNIPQEIGEQELRDLFNQAGYVSRVYKPRERNQAFIPRNRQRMNQPQIDVMGSAIDFAFIHFITKESAERAIKMFHNFKYGFNILEVEKAQKRRK